MIESRLERQVVQYLNKKGCITHKVSSDLYPGFPDRIVIHKNFCFYVELKTITGRLSKGQKAVHEMIRNLSIGVFVVRSLDEIKRIIKFYESLI